VLERQIRGMIDEVKSGRLSRRDFISRMIAAGIGLPAAGTLLAHAGVAQAQSGFAYKPTTAGGGGTLRILQWQAATFLNPHLATGSKDWYGAGVFYEPLAGWDSEGNLVPFLAAEIPSLENGGVAKDGASVTWKLKRGVAWHDGKPFTADDCVFNWEYASDPATGAATIGTYRDITVEKLDSHTIRIVFKSPTPFWADAFVGTRGMLIPKHIFEAYKGAPARDAPHNLKPVGTGPYMLETFRPGDVLHARRNPNYHVPAKPHFDAVDIKGGGDAISAARAVMQTEDYHFAYNLQVEDSLLKRMEAAGKGKIEIVPSAHIEHIQLNAADPWSEVEGERGNPKSRHPIFSDKRVRKALTNLVDLGSIQKAIYGRDAAATANFLNAPARFVSKDTSWSFAVDKAASLLDEAGWVKGPDGIRSKDGRRFKLVFQTATNSLRQKTQMVIKHACQKAGIEVELKTVEAGVFFSSDPANPDNIGHFYADLQMYTSPLNQPDPGAFMQQFLSDQVSSKANNWQGRNVTRWQNAAFDETYRACQAEMDPVKRAALAIRLNDLVVEDVAVIPVVTRKVLAGMKKDIHASLSAWEAYTWDLASWYREA
jgi:peptide/nickel transport system substrate-binding protein